MFQLQRVSLSSMNMLMGRSGGKHGAKPKKCPACSGKGQKVAVDMFHRMATVVCHDCDGSGTILRAKDRCKKCKGTKLTDEKKPLEFWIERGMEDGDHIVLRGEADQEPGKEPGDAIFVLTETDHPVYRRTGPDLRATLHITLKEALCGFSRVILTTLDGRGLKYTHKAGQVIRPKDVFKIVGEGMPVGKKSDEKGRLYLNVEIEFPPDGWLLDSGKVDTLAGLLPTSSTTSAEEVPEIVDDIILEKADPTEFGGPDGPGWETESDGESDGVPEQCTTQ
jgi:DnaJ homolog subfamily A member 2